jgi:hypothetical protein
VALLVEQRRATMTPEAFRKWLAGANAGQRSGQGRLT